jgi:hypothetical protein
LNQSFCLQFRKKRKWDLVDHGTQQSMTDLPSADVAEAKQQALKNAAQLASLLASKSSVTMLPEVSMQQPPLPKQSDPIDFFAEPPKRTSPVIPVQEAMPPLPPASSAHPSSEYDVYLAKPVGHNF